MEIKVSLLTFVFCFFYDTWRALHYDTWRALHYDTWLDVCSRRLSMVSHFSRDWL